MTAELELFRQTAEFAAQNWEPISGLLLIGAVALTGAQRRAIHERDDDRCQAKNDRIRCGGQLEVDHLLPKDYAETYLKLRPDQYNSPENLLLKCQNHHRGHPDSHHPDMHNALFEHRKGDREAFSRAAEDHHNRARRGEAYWNPNHDAEDMTIARIRSEDMDKKKGGRRKWWPF